MRAIVLLVFLAACGGTSEPACLIDTPGSTTVERACAACPGDVVDNTCVADGDTAACRDADEWCDVVVDGCYFSATRQPADCKRCTTSNVRGIPPECVASGASHRCNATEASCRYFYGER